MSTDAAKTQYQKAQDSEFDVNRCSENPVPERSGCMSEELRKDPLHEST